MKYFLGWLDCERLRSQAHAEIVIQAINRLEIFDATETDLEVLRDLAIALGVKIPERARLEND